MYEVEINGRAESACSIPPDVRKRFGEFKDSIRTRTVLPWGEHCTECVWPTCYSTCALYIPREDLRCRLFLDGMVRVGLPGSLNGYLIKIRFRRMGALWTVGNTRLHSLGTSLFLERMDFVIGTVLRHLPVRHSMKRFLIKKRYSMKKHLALRPNSRPDTSSYFLVECYNPAEETVRLTLSIRLSENLKCHPFQRLLALAPGFNRVCIPTSDISARVDLQRKFSIELAPSDSPDEITLFFGFLDFVRDVEYREKTRTCKCVVWDLDNTLWSGTLIEDGPDALVPKPGIIDIIRELDRRGILLSIASKNNPEDAMKVLRHFGIDEYFLYPQISWGPKGKAVAEIARLLNIGADTLVFMDDQPFEREEVKSVVPGITVLDSLEYTSLLDRHEFQVTVTPESAERRKMYQQQALRMEFQGAFDGDYLRFLRECDIVLTIKSLEPENFDRVYELAQRTNQMNFSGNRYSREELTAILALEHLHTYVMDCEDRFGKYGTIGFCVVDGSEPRLIDLMFSCRIQGKRVEHAFLAFLLRRYRRSKDGVFYANFRKTTRNAASGKVFEDMGFAVDTETGGVTSLVFPEGMDIQDDNVIKLVVQKRIERGFQLDGAEVS